MISWVRTMSHYDLYLHITYNLIIDTYCASITTAASEFIIPEWLISHLWTDCLTPIGADGDWGASWKQQLGRLSLIGLSILDHPWIPRVGLQLDFLVEFQDRWSSWISCCFVCEIVIMWNFHEDKNSFYVVLHILRIILICLAQRLELLQIDEHRVYSLKWVVYSTLGSE